MYVREFSSDRYAIRTRNLQSDALPLRQSVEGNRNEDAAAVRLEGDLGQGAGERC